MKKVVSLLLSIVIVLSLASVCVYAATPTATLESDANGTTLKEGDEFVVNIIVPEGSRFNSLMCGIVFDTDLFEVTKTNNGNLGYMEEDEDEDSDTYGEMVKVTWRPEKMDPDQANASGYATWTRTCIGSGNLETVGTKVGYMTLKVKAVPADTSYTFGIMEDNDLTGYLANDEKNAPASTVTVNLDDGVTAPVTPANPVVETPSKADNVKTWNVKIDGGYVTAADKLIATLSNVDDATDNQVVTLDIGSDIIDGDADWAFSFKATFTNADMMDKINLAVAKN